MEKNVSVQNLIDWIFVMVKNDLAACYIIRSLKAVQLHIESGHNFINQAVIRQIVNLLEKGQLEIVLDIVKNRYNVDPAVKRIGR